MPIKGQNIRRIRRRHSTPLRQPGRPVRVPPERCRAPPMRERGHGMGLQIHVAPPATEEQPLEKQARLRRAPGRDLALMQAAEKRLTSRLASFFAARAPDVSRQISERLTLHKAATLSQDEADYVDHPVDGDRCGACSMFRDPDSCTLAAKPGEGPHIIEIGEFTAVQPIDIGLTTMEFFSIILTK